jgi:hypothetical protein
MNFNNQESKLFRPGRRRWNTFERTPKAAALTNQLEQKKIKKKNRLSDSYFYNK